MKRLFVYIVIFLFSVSRVVAQHSHFLYFQTENKNPFYVKINEDKVLNSSASGYLIVPELRAGDYTLTVGFPKSEWPEQIINYTLDKDAGFLLKNFEDKGWGLFDLQSLKVFMPGKKSSIIASVQESKKDSFSEMLATVVNDSTIKENPLILKKQDSKTVEETPGNSVLSEEEVKESKPQPDKSAEPEQIAALQPLNEINDTGQRSNSVKVLYSVITKNLQVKSKDGMELVYIDNYDSDKDTVRILIPVRRAGEKNKDEPAAPPQFSISVKEIKDTVIADMNSLAGEAAEALKQSSQPVPVEVETKNDAEMVAEKTDTVNALSNKQTSPPPLIKEEKKDSLPSKAEEDKMDFLPAGSGIRNVNCRQYATEEDFLKLRKRMAAENDDDGMIRAAKKIFKTKCFTTKSIKNLSALFLSDAGKYQFFDTAYSYVSDGEVFYTLQDQLSEAYFVNRFKAMLLH